METSSTVEGGTRTLAAMLDAARANRRSLKPPEFLATFSLDDAYATQDALIALREASGSPTSGWKLGITSPVKQRTMGIAHPLFGRTFADDAFASGERVGHARFIGPRTEPEIAFGLAASVDPAMDVSALRAAIAWVAPALEITDSRYTSGQRTAAELVSDNTSAGGYVLGARIPIGDAAALDSFRTELVRNGTVVAEGVTADVLGHPLNALKLLAAHLAERGLATRPGDVVLSGAITDAVAVLPGDTFEARLIGLGSATVAFV